MNRRFLYVVSLQFFRFRTLRREIEEVVVVGEEDEAEKGGEAPHHVQPVYQAVSNPHVYLLMYHKI